MPSFLSNGIEIAYELHGERGAPILLILGFASSGAINWVNTGWVEALKQAGYQPITVDNRGHGKSRKVYDPKLYFAHEMADDAANLLDHLGHVRAIPVIGYSMGARIAAFLARRAPERVERAIFGGMGITLVTGHVVGLAHGDQHRALDAPDVRFRHRLARRDHARRQRRPVGLGMIGENPELPPRRTFDVCEAFGRQRLDDLLGIFESGDEVEAHSSPDG
jgi:pimeloyl-ACP methyl ester carboxylesterase